MGKRSSRKGGDYERRFCALLSQWWTGGASDDAFWRTAGSGSRATTRLRKSKQTLYGQGDIQATTPEGVPLLAFCSFELKCGYNDLTFQDLIDAKPHRKPPIYHQWMSHARECANAAGALYWALVHRRDKREDLIFAPLGMFVLSLAAASVRATLPSDATHGLGMLSCATLQGFLTHASPHAVTLATKGAYHVPPPLPVFHSHTDTAGGDFDEETD